MVNNISTLHIVDYDTIQSGVATQALQFTPPPFQQASCSVHSGTYSLSYV
jgi:hypothetical protein